MVFLKDFMKKLNVIILKKISRRQKCIHNYPACKELLMRRLFGPLFSLLFPWYEMFFFSHDMVQIRSSQGLGGRFP